MVTYYFPDRPIMGKLQNKIEDNYGDLIDIPSACLLLVSDATSFEHRSCRKPRI